MRLAIAFGGIAFAASVLGDRSFSALSNFSIGHYASFNISGPDVAGPEVPAPPPTPQPGKWDFCQCKGTFLLKAMHFVDSDAGQQFEPKQRSVQSPFQDYDADLTKWGWHDIPEDDIAEFYFDFDEVWGVKQVFESLHMNKWESTKDGGNNEVVRADHYITSGGNEPLSRDIDRQTYDVDGKTYRSTGSSHTFSVNPIDGVIMTMSRKSVKSAAKDRTPQIPADQLPALNQWSDIGWLYYKNRAEKAKVSPKQLKCFLSLAISNVDTKNIVQKALDRVGAQFSLWPGHSFYPDSDEYKALLGTPNAQGFGYFLIEHKDEQQLGNLFISSITVFRCEEVMMDACMFLTVEPVAPTAPSDPPPSSAADLAKVMNSINSTVSMTDANNILREHILGSFSMPKVIEVH